MASSAGSAYVPSWRSYKEKLKNLGYNIPMRILWILWIFGLVTHVMAEDRSQYISSADDYMKLGQYGKALVQLQKARSLDAAQVTIDQKIRECQMRLGAWVSSEASGGEDWIEVDKLRLDEVPATSHDSLFHVAQGLEQRENYETALRIYAFLAEHRSDRKDFGKAYKELRIKLEQMAQNHSEVGEIFLKQGRLEKAREEFTRASFFQPSNAFFPERIKQIDTKRKELLQALDARLTEVLASGDVDQALVVADHAFREFPEQERFRKVLDSLQVAHKDVLATTLQECRDLLAKQDYAKADARLREALVRFPGEGEIAELQQEARSKLEASRRAAQVDSLDRSLQKAIAEGNVGLAQGLLQGMSTLGASGVNLTERTNQVNELRQKVQGQRDFENALDKSRRALRDGMLDSAKIALQQAMALNAQSPVVQQMLQDIKREESREAEVEVSKRKDVQRAEAFVKAGQIQSAKKVDLTLTGANQVDQEVKQAQRAIREAEYARTPENDKKAQDLFFQGISSYRIGDYADALQKWTLVLKLNPDHEQAQKYIANVKQKLARMK